MQVVEKELLVVVDSEFNLKMFGYLLRPLKVDAPRLCFQGRSSDFRKGDGRNVT